MKGKNLILTGILAAVVGLFMILFRHTLATGEVVRALGIIFVVAGVLNTTIFLAQRDKDGNSKAGVLGTTFGWVASAAAVVLGLAMIFFKESFVGIMGFMFAILILFASLFQVFLLLFGSRPTHLSNWFFLVPTALVGAALYIFMSKPTTGGEAITMIVSGAALMVFGVFTIIEGAAIGQTNHNNLRAARQQPKIEEAPDPRAHIEEVRKTNEAASEASEK